MQVVVRQATNSRVVAGFRIARRWPVIPIFIIVVLIVTGIFAPLISPHDPISNVLRNRNLPPFWYARGNTSFLLGADQIGRDVLSRIIYGGRISLLVVSISLTSGTILGTVLGMMAGYLGGWIEEIIMRIVDVWLGLPFVLTAMVVVVVMGQSLGVIMALLALLAWSPFVRNIRAEVLSLKTRDYVSLAKVAGASNARILVRHVLPGIVNTMIVIATLRVGQLILAEATLSFLGAGIPPPTPSWGSMVADGRDFLATAWWISFFPGMAILLVVLSMNFLGDWFRDRFDPRLRQL